MKQLLSLLLTFFLAITAQTQAIEENTGVILPGQPITEANPVRSFDELMTALKSGRSVKVVIHYGKCKLFSDGIEQAESPNAIGGMDFSTYEYFDSSVFKNKVPSFVAGSQTVLIYQPFYGYVYNYVKVKVKQDNSVEISARYLRPRKFSSRFKVVMDETFKGVINDGNNDGGVYFFVQ